MFSQKTEKNLHVSFHVGQGRYGFLGLFSDRTDVRGEEVKLLIFSNWERIGAGWSG